MNRRQFLLAKSTALLGTVVTAHSKMFIPNLGPNLQTVTVRCGKMALMIRQSSQWTVGRIDYNGHAMTTEESAYGTVLNFPNTGFIGTNHHENEPEPLDLLEFYIDGKKVEPTTPELEGKDFRLVRHSTIRGIKLLNEIKIKDDLLWETITMESEKEIPLNLLYHFMHAWAPTSSEYLAGNGTEVVEEGAFSNDLQDKGKMYLTKKVDWVAVFEPTSQQFAKSQLISAPEVGRNVSMIWNVIGTYRKYYLTCFEKASIPANFKGTWKMVTSFGSASPDRWKSEAQKPLAIP